MAIAHDATSSTTNDGSASYSFNHTVGAGSNRYLLVFTTEETSNDFAEITGITYNGVALTRATGQTMTGANEGTIEAWYLLNPDTGTNSVAVTWNAIPGTGSAVIATSYTGVDQSAPEATAVDAEINPTTHNIPITTLTANAWVVGAVMGTSSGTAITSDGGQNERANVTNAGAFRTASGDKAVASAGAASLQWTFAAGNDCCSVAVALKEAGAGAAGQPLARRVQTVPFLGGSLRQRTI